MGIITGSLTIEQAWNKKKKPEVSCMCTKNIRTINEHNLRNNKKIVRKQEQKQDRIQDRDQDTLLGKGTKIGTLSKLQVRNKNERTRNWEQKFKNYKSVIP